MAIIGSINALQSALGARLQGLNPMEQAGQGQAGKALQGLGLQSGEQAAEAGFGKLFEGMISAVDAKQQDASAITRQVLLGDGEKLHHSVIAMQEASVAFSLMVEVRNKLVDSYQELMRMPV